MKKNNYSKALEEFSWQQMRESLGWGEAETVSLGAAIIDRHRDEASPALISLLKDGTVDHLSFRELYEASNRFANLLASKGVAPGDRVAGFMPRGPEVVIAIIGTLKAGAVYVPVFTGFGPEAVAFRLTHSGARLLVTHEDFLGQLPDAISGELIVVAGDGLALPPTATDFYKAISAQSTEFDSITTRRDDPAAIIYTSGSTGQPKGGVIAVNFLAAVYPYILYGLDLAEGDVFWPTGDPGWGYGFVCYLGAIAAGRTVVTVEQNPSAEMFMSVVERFNITNVATTPTLLRTILTLPEPDIQGALQKIRAISSCGEPLNAKVIESFDRILGVKPMDHFGATELALPIGNHNAIDMEVRPGSMGLPSPGYRMGIIDEAGIEMPPGEVGLLAKKSGPDCLYWLNYWGDPEASAHLMKQGWIVTGDLASRDAEGYFWFEGRSDDIIKSAGYRIGPFEIESVLLKHPAVAEAAVVGKPDTMRGQIVKAYVVLKSGFSGGPELDQELVQLVRGNVGKHQYPREIEYVDTLPKTETGKIQRFALRQISSGGM
jgi:acetyl-CoA synthetase|tara:strand:- start:24952 stop:26589 length:1638 start_codon:yes stop_codon:yes gene_type:complete